MSKFPRDVVARTALILFCVAKCSFCGETVFDQSQASAEAQLLREARDRQTIAMQLATIDYLRWSSGLPTKIFGFPQSWSDIYAFPRSAGVPELFQPWPYAAGDIWGFRWSKSVRQPIGRVEIQTGPNRWESHPIYSPEETLIPLPSGSFNGNRQTESRPSAREF